MAMQWDESMACGEEEIDRQHQALFAELPPLLEACKQGKELGEISKLMTCLENYAARHFYTEERLQKEYGDPMHLAHKAEHDRFKAHLSSLKELLIADGATIRFVMLISYIVEEWITRHADTMDRSFAQFVRERKKC